MIIFKERLNGIERGTCTPYCVATSHISVTFQCAKSEVIMIAIII